jgi:hypothetical protein
MTTIISSDSDDHIEEVSRRIHKTYQRRKNQYENEPLGAYEQYVRDTADVDPFEDIRKKRQALQPRSTGK